MFAHGGQMDEDGAKELVGDLDAAMSGVLGGGKSAATKVGKIRRKFPGTGQFEDYDVFAAKVG